MMRTIWQSAKCRNIVGWSWSKFYFLRFIGLGHGGREKSMWHLSLRWFWRKCIYFFLNIQVPFFSDQFFVPNAFTGVFMVFFQCQCKYATSTSYFMHQSHRILRWQPLLWLNIESKSRLFRTSLEVGSSFSVLWKVFCQINFAAAPFC